MALGISEEIQGARSFAPKDRCPHPRPFSPDFNACPAYQPTTFNAADSYDRELHTHLTCRRLVIGADPTQTGRFYPRCALGDSSQRRRWVARIGPERLQLVRELQREFDQLSDPHHERLYGIRGRVSADPTDWKLRDEMDRALAEYRDAVEAFLAEREERFRDAGLAIEPMQELLEESLAAWARNRIGRASRLDPALLSAFSPEAQAFMDSMLDAHLKPEDSTEVTVFDDGMLEITRAGAPPRLALSGQIDVSNAAAAGDALEREGARLEDLSIDLSALTFCDLNGLRAILAAAAKLSGRSTLRLSGLTPQLRRTMDLAQLEPPPNLAIVPSEGSP